MNSTQPLVEEFVSALVEAFPVEDIWYLDSRTAKECRLREAVNLVIIVSSGGDASKIEEEATALIRKKFQGQIVGIHAFPQSAMFQTPRPLLVKMAFSSGHHAFCR